MNAISRLRRWALCAVLLSGAGAALGAPTALPAGPELLSPDQAFRMGLTARVPVVRLELEGDKVVHEERLLEDFGARIRDVRQGPDGFLYILTDSGDGKLLRLEPAG